jgi:isocitrate dehydrogenase
MGSLKLGFKISGDIKMQHQIPITVALGDGIGPEIMEATLFVLREAGAPLEIQEVEIGEKVYMRGVPTGIEASTWDKIRHSKAFLKAPITTPQGGGFKSLNVTIRTTLGLYANVRPCVSYSPFVQTKHPGMDVVIVRENEEDLYMGIEYRQTTQSYEALKIMTRPGCERIIRFAFEYAVTNNRKKVTCFTKDNILKLTDGLFHKVFEEIGKDYPEIETEHWIIDIGTAKLADTPEMFDVIVLPNLYGDILSDVAAQIAGSVGLAGSANIGSKCSMFEAIHGSAPRRAGQNFANPSGLMLASILMLVHLELPEKAALIHNAWLKTIEDGVHTQDIYKEGISSKPVGTKEFSEAVAARLGKQPETLPAVSYGHAKPVRHHPSSISVNQQKVCIGVDVFLEHTNAEELIRCLTSLQLPEMSLQFINNRGVQVWPNPHPETLHSDCWRCRFIRKEQDITLQPDHLIELLQALHRLELDVVQVQNLFHFSEGD